MKTSTNHSYKGILDKSSSEYQHQVQLNHFTEKISFEVFAKSEAEHEQTKKAISLYPCKNHKPCNKK